MGVQVQSLALMGYPAKRDALHFLQNLFVRYWFLEIDLFVCKFCIYLLVMVSPWGGC